MYESDVIWYATHLVYPIVGISLVYLSVRWARRRLTFRGRGFVIGFAALVLIFAPAWTRYIFNPLPKDDEIIERWKAHRADLDELVRRYRTFNPGPQQDHGTHWLKPADVQVRMKRSQISRLVYQSEIWLPSPYSVETARTRDTLSSRAPAKNGFNIRTRYGVVQLDFAPFNHYATIVPGGYGLIWKDLVHIPQVAKVSEGKLWKPMDADGRMTRSSRVFPSLNRYPENWKLGECVYRQLDDHWFLRMCRGHL